MYHAVADRKAAFDDAVSGVVKVCARARGERTHFRRRAALPRARSQRALALTPPTHPPTQAAAAHALSSRSGRDGGFTLSRAAGAGGVPHARLGQGSSAAAATAFLRRGPFATLLPSDGVVEQVLSTSVNSFLNIYNTILVVRFRLMGTRARARRVFSLYGSCC